MRFLVSALLSLFLLIPPVNAKGKDKNKTILPDYVLKAQTVLVVISPDAATSLRNPNENRTAREDVEKALMQWGRLTPVLSGQEADLVIAVRKGGGNSALDPTVRGGPRDDRPVIVEPTDGSVHVGIQQGHPPPNQNYPYPGDGQPPTSPGVSRQIGGSEDSFEVYRGVIGAAADQNPLDGPPVWRYMAKDALRSPSVPAVDQFRKLIEQAEKEAQKRSKKGP